MRFLFVDKVTSMDGKNINGSKTFAKDEAMQYQEGPRKGEIASGVISEAIGQLVSWLAIRDNNFTGRPVFLFADKISIKKKVMAGETVELKGEINRTDEQSFVFSGTAYVNGVEVQSIHQCNGFQMPLADLEDPEVTKQRLHDLQTSKGLVLQDDGRKFDMAELVDSVDEMVVGESIVARKKFTGDEPFFADHFPRFPVVPIVMINEMIGRVASRMLTDGKDPLVPVREVKNIKIKSFVRPGDECQIVLKRDHSEALPGCATVRAEIKKDGKPILRGTYSFSMDK